MSTPKIAGKVPIPVEVEAGKRYAWCTCGESQNQPFCDGSHREAGIFSPKIEVFEESKKIFFCTCKQTKNPGRCDGSHKTLLD